MKIVMFDIEQVPDPECIWTPYAGFKVDKSLLLSAAFTDHNSGNSEVFHLDKNELAKYTQITEDACLGKLTEDQIYNARREVDKPLCEAVLNRLNQADLIITWYGSRHDMKYMNGKAILLGLQPCVQVRHIDIYFTFRNKCSFSSNRLGNIAKRLNLKLKGEISPRQWDVVRNGRYASLKEIADYNINDTESLDEIFQSVKSLIKGLPRAAIDLHLDRDELKEYCRYCGSSNTRKNGHYYSPERKIQRHKCLTCGCSYV